MIMIRFQENLSSAHEDGQDDNAFWEGLTFAPNHILLSCLPTCIACVCACGLRFLEKGILLDF